VIHLLSAGGKKFPPVLLARWRSVLFLARVLVRFVAFDRELGRRRRRKFGGDIFLPASLSSACSAKTLRRQYPFRIERFLVS